LFVVYLMFLDGILQNRHPSPAGGVGGGVSWLPVMVAKKRAQLVL
jgi:hypothetical protein